MHFNWNNHICYIANTLYFTVRYPRNRSNHFNQLWTMDYDYGVTSSSILFLVQINSVSQRIPEQNIDFNTNCLYGCLRHKWYFSSR